MIKTHWPAGTIREVGLELRTTGLKVLQCFQGQLYAPPLKIVAYNNAIIVLTPQ